MYKKLGGLIVFLVLAAVATSAAAEDLGEGRWVADGIYRATDFRGLTGLFFTDSAYTIGNDNFGISSGFTTQKYAGATVDVVPVTLTWGSSENTEFGLSGRYVSDSIAGKGAGDTELAWKWRFRRQTQYLPALAMAFGVIAPGSPGLSDVTKYGARANLLASSESALTDTAYIGLYLDLEVDSYDPGQSTQDNFYKGNFGLLFPISDNNRLQVIVESNTVGKRTAAIDNYNAVTAGGRYCGSVFQLTGAVQALSRADGTKDDRVLFNLAAQF